MQKGIRPRPFVGIWPRGGGKSTTAELAAVALGALDRRAYCVYVRRNQDMADKSIGNIATLLESSAIDRTYPNLGRRRRGKFGNAKGWRRERLSTAHGYTVDALGLDSASRGFKDEERRPDLFIIDDIDDKHDSPAVAQKNIETITTSILPAGSNDAAVLAVQNLIIPHGLFSQLAGPADYLADRIVDGPYPAVEGLQYEQRLDPETERYKWVITEGAATWAGQDLATCQQQIFTWGLMAFRQESQHEVDLISGGLYDDLLFQYIDRDKLPALTAIECWLDPAVSSTESSDSQGIQIDGRDAKKHLYRLYSWEGVTSPQKAMEKAILQALHYGARAVGVETDQGGDTWISVYNEAWNSLKAQKLIGEDARRPRFKYAKAGSIGGKVERQNMMRAAYDRGEITHVRGTHQILENGLKRFPIRKPFDLADAAFWGWYNLIKRGGWSQGPEDEGESWQSIA